MTTNTETLGDFADDRATAQIEDAADAISFILAGKAVVTLVSAKTRARFTYRIRKGKDSAPHFVGLFTGSNNEGAYSFLGTIFDGARFRLGRKSRIAASTPAARAFVWMFRALSAGTIPPQLQIWHEGRCGRCARLLTVPASISTGIGPVCAGRVTSPQGVSQ